MLKFYKFGFRPIFLFYQNRFALSKMEAKLPNIKLINYKTDTYGDYP